MTASWFKMRVVGAVVVGGWPWREESGPPSDGGEFSAWL
jgi:hypothetical protein